MKDIENQNMFASKFSSIFEQRKELWEGNSRRYHWPLIARPSQLPPKGDWRIWIILAGRGFGKTRTGAETLRQWVQQEGCRRLALIGETAIEVRQVMVEGPSGILAVHPPSERPKYEASKHLLTWPNGAVATCFSAEAYENLRGPQFDGAWIDEFAKFREAEKVWDQLMFGLRLGEKPRVVITTTPRSTKFLKSLCTDPSVVVTKGSTFENADNLARPFLDYMRSHYENRSLGRQEIYADFVEEQEGALWTPSLLERARMDFRETPLRRIVIAIDPAISHGKKSDETGIIAAGVTTENIGVVLEDLSLKTSPLLWIRKAVEAYHRLQADRIVAEVNMGGELIEQMLRLHHPTVSYKPVYALRNKILRAEPVASLYERGKVWHADVFPELEKQLCSYHPSLTSKSPDRLDALVWALTDLMLTVPFQPRAWLC